MTNPTHPPEFLLARKVAFTGTRWCMTPRQRGQVRRMLLELAGDDVTFHHGGDQGADFEFHNAVFEETSSRIVVHRGCDKQWRHPRAMPTVYHPRIHWHQWLPYLKRNINILTLDQQAGLLIAATKTAEEQRRSGTWYTIRRAREQRIQVRQVLPDGDVICS